MVAASGFAENGLTARGYAENGLTTSGFAKNGLTASGFAENGLTASGFAENGLTARGFALKRRKVTTKKIRTRSLERVLTPFLLQISIALRNFELVCIVDVYGFCYVSAKLGLGCLKFRYRDR